MRQYWSIILRTALGGSSNAVNKLIINSIPTYYFILLRQIGMILVVLTIGRSKLINEMKMVFREKEMLKWLFLSGLFAGMASAFFYLGLSELPVSVVSVLENVFNLIFVTLIAVVFMKEKRTKRFYALFFMLMPALYLVVFENVVFDVTLSFLGVFALIVSSFFAALEVHITKKQVEKISVSAVVLSKALVSIFVAIACIFIFENKWEDLVSGFSYVVLMSLVYGMINTYFIKTLDTKAIKEIGPVQTTVFLILTPVFSILFAMLIFGEVLTLTQWIGVLMIIVILYFIKDA